MVPGDDLSLETFCRKELFFSEDTCHRHGVKGHFILVSLITWWARHCAGN